MKKKQLIEKHLKEPIKVGDIVYVRGLGSQNKEAWGHTTKVVDVEDDGQTIVYIQHKSPTKVNVENVRKYVGDIGANPINDSMWRKVQNINYTLESVLFTLGLGLDKNTREEKYTTDKGFLIKNCNFNPFVEINGEKMHYQRDFVWTLVEMQALVHSIYNRVDCGKIVVRERGWKWLHERDLEGECYWYDVVDAKQRLITIHKFLNNEFTDKFGNYFEDLSAQAQRKFLDHQLFSYSKMGEDATDEDVLKQFLSINFTGVPQSKEHIEYVESLLKK